MAMNSVEMGLFLFSEDDDDFGFEHLLDETEDQWELVNPSDAGSDSVADVESSSAISEVLPTLSRSAILWAPATSADGSPFPDNADQGLDQLLLAVAECCEQLRNQGCSDGADDCKENESDEGEDDDGLDDELVPRHLRGKLGRQRMRKLGKRACSKMNTSKRSPHLYVKPGCLYGKHGLGLKHSLC